MSIDAHVKAGCPCRGTTNIKLLGFRDLSVERREERGGAEEEEERVMAS